MENIINKTEEIENNLPKRYFIKHKLINRPFVLYKVNERFIGKTEDDYYRGLMFEVTESQAKFYEDNPEASFIEIMNKKLNEKEDATE